LHPEIQFQKNGNINGKTPTEVEAILNTIRIYPKNAAKIFSQNLYLQSSPVSDLVSFHLTTIDISPIKLIVQTVYAVNQKQYIIIYCNARIMRKKGKDLELNSISLQEV
jgi:hypothetical protein